MEALPVKTDPLDSFFTISTPPASLKVLIDFLLIFKPLLSWFIKRFSCGAL
jgi:hypothetical protein